MESFFNIHSKMYPLRNCLRFSAQHSYSPIVELLNKKTFSNEPGGPYGTVEHGYPRHQGPHTRGRHTQPEGSQWDYRMLRRGPKGKPGPPAPRSHPSPSHDPAQKASRIHPCWAPPQQARGCPGARPE